MSLNLIALGLMLAVVGYHAVQAYLSPGDPEKPKLPWVPIDVRKTKHYVSQTRDAGMYIERQRRVAIIGNSTLSPSYKGSTNGSLEWNFLTGICVCPPRSKICPTVFGLVDGQYVDADSCNVLDGMGSEVADFGNAWSDECPGVCPPAIYETHEGGNVDAEVCDVFDGMGTEVADFGGAADANVC